jgi:hypothetical protein
MLGFKYVNGETNFLVVIFCERKKETIIFINIILGDPIIETSTWKLVTTVSEKPSTSISMLEARQVRMRTYYVYRNGRPCYSSGGWSPVSHRGGSSSSPDQVMWDLWWTKWHWGQVFS